MFSRYGMGPSKNFARYGRKMLVKHLVLVVNNCEGFARCAFLVSQLVKRIF